MEISSSGKILGATVKGIDLAQPLSDRDCKRILRALGAYGVLCFPDQRLETQELARFGRMFGELEINIANQFHEPGFPEENLRVIGPLRGVDYFVSPKTRFRI
jgi:taurine dioxygenase